MVRLFRNIFFLISVGEYSYDMLFCRGQLKRNGTRAETRFRLSAKRTSPFKSAGASVQPTTGGRGVRISGSMFRGSVKGTGYPLHSPVSPSLPSCASPCAITFQLESTTKRQLPYSTPLPLQNRRPYLRCINSTFQADIQHNLSDPIARSKAWVCGRWLAGIADMSVRLL